MSAMQKIPDLAGSPAMQRIMSALHRKSNMSASDISEEAFVGLTTLACGGYIRALKNMRLIYVSGWRQVKGRFSTPLHSLGDLPDVARPEVDNSCRDAPGMWKILAVLERLGPLSYHDIALHSGLSPNTIKNSGYLDALVVQKHIHISSWRRSRNGPMLPIYMAGAGQNTAKPEVISRGEKGTRNRTRKRLANFGSEWYY